LDGFGRFACVARRRQDRRHRRINLIRAAGLETPPGFAITAQAYRDGSTKADTWTRLRKLLHGLDVRNVKELTRRAGAIAARRPGNDGAAAHRSAVQYGSANAPPLLVS